ncbi:CopD family protein [Actinomadura rupiterrae]|uniref:CopD family protein n=1 Tax=Actinomadura rupiterrae TaxID=559627 RepID=UPI0020A2F8B0|nr:CopD family protein [Actinomadura rupiterrae]MCP2336887.1 hypothetical protein [Actinomadura rupiterrae]
MRALFSFVPLLCYAVAAALAAWPAGVGYTLVAGDKATATVQSCRMVTTRHSHTRICEGDWRKPDGTTGSGRIYNLDSRDAGHDVAVRLGPYGPYAHGFGRWIWLKLVLFGAGIALCFGVVAAVIRFARQQEEIKRRTAAERAVRRLRAESPKDPTGSRLRSRTRARRKRRAKRRRAGR